MAERGRAQRRFAPTLWHQRGELLHRHVRRLEIDRVFESVDPLESARVRHREAKISHQQVVRGEVSIIIIYKDENVSSAYDQNT